MSVIRTVVAGVGSYLPTRVVTNDDLSKIVDTTDEWIVERTGIHSRHIAADGELTSHLALAAARNAIADAGIDVQEIDTIILATTTPDNTFPATATTVQAELGLYHGAAFDIQAVCSGFVYAMTVADTFIKTGQSKTALVIGAETFSRLLDWTDRTTCVLFGDGAGAVATTATSSEAPTQPRVYSLAWMLYVPSASEVVSTLSVSLQFRLSAPVASADTCASPCMRTTSK